MTLPAAKSALHRAIDLIVPSESDRLVLKAHVAELLFAAEDTSADERDGWAGNSADYNVPDGKECRE